MRRYGRKVGIKPESLQKVEAVFARYGAVAVGVARFVNILRQLNGVVAGALEMHWLKFLFFNALGGAVWVAAWTTAGFYLGKNDTKIEGLVQKLGLYGLVIAALAARPGHRRHLVSKPPRQGAVIGAGRNVKTALVLRNAKDAAMVPMED